MRIKLLLTLLGLLAIFAIPAAAQDNGAPDTLKLEVTVAPCASQGNLNVQMDLYGFNDANAVFGASVGFSWDNPNLQMDSATVSALASSSFMQTFTYDGNITNTNERQRFQFGGLNFFNSMAPAPESRLWASYYFTLSSWDVNSSIAIDTFEYDGGTTFLIIDADQNEYLPVWAGGNEPIIIRDCDYVECDAPIITCPTAPIDVPLCAPGQVCVDLPISGADNVTVDGATWSGGQLCFDATSSDQYVFNVVASVDCGEQSTCDVTVNVDITPEVSITCPTSTVDAFICAPGQVCVDLPIANADEVTVDGATWSAGQLCFTANEAGIYSYLVNASNSCGSDFCNIVIDVAIGAEPVITCPTTIDPVFLCGAGEVCIDLPIAGADYVTVEGASWSDGQLCFQATATQTYNFHIEAGSDCGTATCDIAVEVEIGEGAVITCPTEPIDRFLCEAGQVCIDLPITGADLVTVEGATWADDQLCFDATATDTYTFQVVASNDCGDVTCNITVNVTLGATVAITCPVDPISVVIQEPGLVCVDLPIAGADLVTVEGATWANDQLCFTATDSMVYTFSVLATNACGEAACTLDVDVQIIPPCVDIVLSEDEFYFSWIEGSVITVLPSDMLTVSSSDAAVNFDFTATAPVDAPWVELSSIGGPFEGTTPADVSVVVNPADLGVGMHTATCTVASTDWRVCEPMMKTFTVSFEIFPAPSADTVVVATEPAVPGMQVAVPVSFTNSCFLYGVDAVFAWESADLHLDSVSYATTSLAGFDFMTVIDNDLRTVAIGADVGEFGSYPPASGNDLANLHFTVSCDAIAGMYPIMLGDDGTPLLFDRDCGGGMETEAPEFISGGIIVDTSANYVCGYVVEDNGMGGYEEIEGAHVQLWADFPIGDPIQVTTSGHIGSFAFSDFTQIPFDIYAYKEGYYPATAENLNFGDKGVMIVLTPVPELSPTDMWVDYYCETNTILDVPMPVGFVIEAYANGVLCGRQMIDAPGRYPFMPVYRDSLNTPGIEGANTGDIIAFYVNGTEAMASGNVIYPDSWTEVEVCLEAGSYITKTCDLMEGWNLISWNVNTESDVITDVLGPYMDCIDVVLGFEMGGLTFDPLLPQFSTLDYVDHESGYWIKVKEGCQVTLELEGLPVLSNTPIAINAGWNLVSYLPDYMLAPEEALATIYDELLVAYGFDEGAMIFKPDMGGFNSLDAMSPCFGFWVKASAPGTLVYPGAGVAAPAARINQHALAAAALAPRDVTPTSDWVNVYSSNLTLDGELVQAGATISAYNAEGKKIGGFALTETGKFGFMPVYANDASGENVAGLEQGETFYLAVDDVVTNERFVWTNSGDRLEVTSLTAQGSGGELLPDTYSLAQNYPNPFNPSTSIAFNMPATGHAKIEVFNVLGKLVAVPYDEVANAGENVVQWDGLNSAGEQVSSGVYFYRLTSDNFSDTKKMMLLK